MTPEEINRTIEFILQVQARNEISQEQHKETLRRHDKLLQQLAVRGKQLVELTRLQSSRLDRAEEADRAAQKRDEEWRKRQDELLRQLRIGIDRIMDKLGGVQ